MTTKRAKPAIVPIVVPAIAPADIADSACIGSGLLLWVKLGPSVLDEVVLDDVVLDVVPDVVAEMVEEVTAGSIDVSEAVAASCIKSA